jgi:hypothetical protein
MTSPLIKLSSEVAPGSQIPRIIHQMVEAADPPPGTHNRVVSVYASFLDKFTERLAKRAFVPINEIAFEAAHYEHSVMDREKPVFPHGYPVIGVHFNGAMVGITGISFEGTECSMHHAETTSAQFLLKAEPKWLRAD